MKLLNKARGGLLLILLGGGALYAQPDDSAGAGQGSAQGSASVQGTTQSNLSLVEMQGRATELKDRIQDDLRHVKHLQELARKQKDIIKLNCVNDKFLEIKPQANMFDDVYRDLNAMSADAPDRFTVFASVTTAAENVHKARIEADQCIGEGELGTEASNGFEHPPFPLDPTVGNPFDNPVEPPGYASPYN